MVFRITTLEGWTENQDNLRSTFGDFVIIYFVLLIFIGNFFVMNMMLAVIKSKFSEVHLQNELELKKKSSNEDFKLIDEEEPFSYTIKDLSEYAKFY